MANKSLEHFSQSDLKKIIIPIVSDKERAGEYCINTRAGEDFINEKKNNLLSDRASFQNKVKSKGEDNHNKTTN